MQSLLADRFKLTIHVESKQGPVFALLLAKPGKTGPLLKPHVDDGSCSVGTPQPVCGASTFGMQLSQKAPGRVQVAARGITIAQIAEWLPGLATKIDSGVDRPVIDHTGLGGSFDLDMEFTPQLYGTAPIGFQPETSGPSFFEALQEQAGLKLVSATGAVEELVVDHVEEPSPN